jgi:hypothetical protein
MAGGFFPSLGGTLRRVDAPSKASGDLVSAFVVAIPTPAVFYYAWAILIDLMLHGLKSGMSSANELAKAHSALHWYGRWLIEKSTTHTWASVCRYHLRVCAKRFAGSFHTKSWYDNVDTDAATDLVQLSSRASPTPQSKTASAPLKRRKLASKKRDVSEEICFKWNTIGCRDNACPRKHACENCGRPHTKRQCVSAPKRD